MADPDRRRKLLLEALACTGIVIATLCVRMCSHSAPIVSDRDRGEVQIAVDSVRSAVVDSVESAAALRRDRRKKADSLRKSVKKAAPKSRDFLDEEVPAR